MIKECKKCGSKNLFLEPRIKGQDVMTADMVALKCRDCGVWLKWCPKDERKYYYTDKQSKDKWQKLKEWLRKAGQGYMNDGFFDCAGAIFEVIYKMRELEAEDVED